MNEANIQALLDSYQIVYINGVALNNPKPAPPYNFSKKEQDLDSGVNLTGYMERNVLEHHRRTLDLTFNSMNGIQMTTLLNLIDNPVLSVTAFDPWFNELRTYEMMHGDLNPTIDRFDYNPDTGIIEAIYNPFTIQLVEY